MTSLSSETVEPVSAYPVPSSPLETPSRAESTPAEPSLAAEVQRPAEPEPDQAIKTIFNLEHIENNHLYLENKPNPYKFKTDMNEIEMKCDLCLNLKCCPEHCCNVSEIINRLLVVNLTWVLFTVGHVLLSRLRRLLLEQTNWPSETRFGLPQSV